MDIFFFFFNGEISSFTCYEDDVVKCIMDANPNSPGHLLVIPKEHYTTFFDIPDDVLLHINKVAKDMAKKMEERLDGYIGAHIAVNYGAPQAIKHYHLHIIPVYKSDLDKTQEEICEILKWALSSFLNDFL